MKLQRVLNPPLPHLEYRLQSIAQLKHYETNQEDGSARHNTASGITNSNKIQHHWTREELAGYQYTE